MAWNNSWNIRENQQDAAGGRRKPDGGFCLVTGMAFIAAWRAYKAGIIRWFDFRVWLACFEVVARRCGNRRSRCPRYQFSELNSLVGPSSGGRVSGAVRRLQKAGLIRWSETAVELTVPMTLDISNELGLSPAQLEHRIPFPRRMIRWLARAGRPVLVATVLGLAMRCLWYRRGLCYGEGSCKASWIADLFSVDLRNVKAARKELMALGWVKTCSVPQQRLNRCGAKVDINLEWAEPRPMATPQNSPPPPAAFRHESPPLIKNLELSSRVGNQKPASGRPAGVFTKARDCTVPRIERVTVDDLKDRRRLGVLFEQARKRGWVTSSENDRLRFVAAAFRARRVGTVNPPGLFVTLVRLRSWHYASLVDEDAARRMLAEDPSGNGHVPNQVHQITNVQNTCPELVSNILTRLFDKSAVFTSSRNDPSKTELAAFSSPIQLTPWAPLRK